jgi:hypothetical protein
MRARTLLIALICAVMAPFSALAGSFMDVYGETTPPAGFICADVFHDSFFLFFFCVFR